MSATTQSRWYVVHTHPNAETKAVAHLGRQGFATYLPYYLKKRRHARRVETVQAPLFPRYLFVMIDTAIQGWRAINSTVGVSKLVCNGEEPAALPECVIEALRAREDERGLIRLPVRVRFTPGDKVRLLDGVFADCLGLFEGMRDNERISVLIDLLGRKVRLLVSVDAVAAA